MSGEARRRGISRRLLLGAAVVLGGVAWGGSTLARLGRDPSGPKSAGRIGDVDGRPLALEPPKQAPAFDPALPWSMKGGTINDASALSATPIYGMVEISEEAHVARALDFARANGLRVSMAAMISPFSSWMGAARK